MLIYPLNPRHVEAVVRDPEWKGRVRDPRFRLSNPVVGLALSLPGNTDAIPLRYTVNPVWLEKERGGS